MTSPDVFGKEDLSSTVRSMVMHWHRSVRFGLVASGSMEEKGSMGQDCNE